MQSSVTDRTTVNAQAYTIDHHGRLGVQTAV